MGASESRSFADSLNVTYSKNPALCMADFITRPESIGGLERKALGTSRLVLIVVMN